MELKMFDIEWDKYPAFAYQNLNNRLVVSKALMLFSIVSCKHCHIINHTSEFIEVSKNHEKEIYSDDINIFLEQHMYDNIRIATAFDNYMKAALLCSHALIHQIVRKKPYTELSTAQLTRPIGIKELLQIAPFEKTEKEGFMHHPGLHTNTLNLTNMLEPEYAKVGRLSEPLIKSLKEILEERNKVHLYIMSDIIFQKVLDQLREINPATTEMFPKLLDHINEALDKLGNLAKE